MSDGQGRGWAAVAVWVAIQLTLTSLHGSSIPVSLPHPLDWFGHAGLYAGLALLIARVGAFHGWKWQRLILAGALISLGGALDELHQLFIPGRAAEVGDWMSDTIGAAVGLTVGAQLMRSRFAAWLR